LRHAREPGAPQYLLPDAEIVGVEVSSCFPSEPERNDSKDAARSIGISKGERPEPAGCERTEKICVASRLTLPLQIGPRDVAAVSERSKTGRIGGPATPPQELDRSRSFEAISNRWC
jgi:hypothetical protein